MSRILSIDFDLIMYPCIKLYNERVGGTDNPTQLWEFLDHEYDINEFICYDAKTLLELAILIKKAVNNGAILHLITEHQEIVDKIKDKPGFDEEEFFVYNVDFHHDIWYRPEDKNMLTMFDEYNCSNWLGYLYLQNKTKEIHWIKAANSAMFNDPDPEFDPHKIFTSVSSLSEFLEETDYQFEEIYFCLSPQWVPYKFQHLYSLIAAMVESEVCTNDEYCDECE